MYQTFFGLNRPPFKITPDTSLFYEGSERGATLEALIYSIKSGEGIIKVVGEVGSGKTMLCRMLEERLREDVDIVYIANPSLSPDNILPLIAHELNLALKPHISKVDVMQQIQIYLLKKHAKNRQVVLFVEEAQSMPDETLEEIRLLSNLETHQNKLLQMVLFGQPELNQKLSQTHIRQLKERITQSFHLSPFTTDDILQYLNFRLRAVGYKGPDIFNHEMANGIKKYSNGLIRRINIIADKSLLAAYSQESFNVTKQHIKSAAHDSEFERDFDRKKYIMALFGLTALIVALALGYYLGQIKKQALVNKTEMIQIIAPLKKGINHQNFNQDLPEQLKNKLLNTKKWLNKTKLNHYSIQLFMSLSSDYQQVELFLSELPETIDFNKIYIAKTKIKSKSWYRVLYDNFASLDKTKAVLNKLPASLQVNQPYILKLSTLKNDMPANKK